MVMLILVATSLTYCALPKFYYDGQISEIVLPIGDFVNHEVVAEWEERFDIKIHQYGIGGDTVLRIRNDVDSTELEKLAMEYVKSGKSK